MAMKFKETQVYKDWKRALEDIRPMPFWKKVDHLWYCYRVYIIFSSICVIFLGVLIGSYISYQSKTDLVSGMVVNLDIKQAGRDYLTVEYAEHLGADKNEYAGLEYTYFGSLEDPFNADNNYSKALILIARVEGEMVDYVLLNESGMKTYVIYDVFLDLREFFTPEQLADLEAQGRLKYAQYEGETDKRPVGVEITDIPFVQENVEGEEKVYFALSGHNPDLGICQKTWDYLHAWEDKAE